MCKNSESIKTRIETSFTPAYYIAKSENSKNSESIKTRIETDVKNILIFINIVQVRIVNPLKQGLKLMSKIY